MKKTVISFAFIACFAVSAAHADIQPNYGVNIFDGYDNKGNNSAATVDASRGSYDKAQYNLFNLFNVYFADQLGGNLYGSSNELFSDRGLDPNAKMNMFDSELTIISKNSSLTHTLTAVDANKENVGYYNDKNYSSGTEATTSIADGTGINWTLDSYNGATKVYSWSSDPTLNDDKLAHMVSFDVTDLYNDKFGTNVSSAIMFGWEDLTTVAFQNGGWAADWDFQDLVGIVTYTAPSENNVTPEPATMSMLAVGGLGLAFMARRRKNAR